jgi:hypothetical protein
LLSVEGRDEDGIRVTLNLQRTTTESGQSWHTVSWRTQYASGSNRRFYVVDGRPWQIPIDLAVRLLTDFERKGGLDDSHFMRGEDRAAAQDWRLLDISGSRELQPPGEVLIPGEDWGHTPQWVIFGHAVPPADGFGQWRKIMLVNLDTAMVTFRSTTTDARYRPRKVINPGSDWVLDNSMQDASVQDSRVFYERLGALTSF